MNFLKSFSVFLIINFGALAIGSLLMGNGPITEWYINLNQAPWTPPGWVFGAAWTFIMICFSMYMAYLYIEQPNKKIILMFLLQFVLNIIWNFIFFNQHMVLLGLIVITTLTAVIAKFLYDYRSLLKAKSLLILPYVIWLIIATSLNAYIYLYN